LNSTATLWAQDNTVTSNQSREAADRLAIERGEDDGMIIRQDVTESAHNRRDLNVITAR
jgi:hypothetical protein